MTKLESSKRRTHDRKNSDPPQDKRKQISSKKSTILSSSIVESPSSDSLPLLQKLNEWKEKARTGFREVEWQDLAVVTCYGCNTLALGIPIILIPMIVADPSFGLDMNAAAFAGTVVSFASLGAAVGKIVNGYFVKLVGGRNSASLYMIGIAFFSIMLSTTSKSYSYAVAGMEFCASIMWVACGDIFSNKYEEDPTKFSQSITKLSLASTSGTLLAKTAGAGLLAFLDWRNVARVSALFAVLGACVMQFSGTPITSNKTSATFPERQQYLESGNFIQSIFSSYSRVLSNKTFWLCSLAQSIGFSVRSSDKILGTFYNDIANLPASLCGSLTISITLGYVFGLISGGKLNDIKSTSGKKDFVNRNYIRATVAAIVLALSANDFLVSSLGGVFCAGIAVIASGVMGSCLSYQYYQFPSLVSKGFGDDRSISLALIDSVALFTSSYIVSVIGKIASNTELGSYGWTLAWIFLGLCTAIGGRLTDKFLPSIYK